MFITIVGKIIACIFLLTGIILFYCFSQQIFDKNLLLFLFAFYAGIGVFFLLCFIFDLCHFHKADTQKDYASLLVNDLSDMLVLTTDSGKILYKNAPYRSLAKTGLVGLNTLSTNDEQLGQAIYQLSSSLQLGKYVTCELNSGKNLFFQEDVQNNATENKMLFTYQVAAKKISEEQGAVILWIITDLTKQRKKQEYFIKNLQEAINHLDHAPTGFVSWDKEGRIIYLNEAFAHWFHVDISCFDAMKIELASLIGKENFWKICQGLQNSSNNKEGCKISVSSTSNGERAKHFRFFMADIALNFGNNDVFRAVVLEDFVQNSLVPNDKDALSQDPLFKNYFDNNPIACAIIDQNMTIHHVNKQFLYLFGADVHCNNTVTFDKYLLSLSIKDREYLKNEFDQIFSNKKTNTPFNVTLISKKKLFLKFHVTLLPRTIYNTSLALISVIETMEQNVFEQQIGHDQKIQAIGQLAGGIAHDFNNVLTAILMSCDLLLGNHRSSDPSHPEIMNIKNNANRAASLVRQLLAFSRRQTLMPKVVVVTDILADLRLLLIRLIGNNIALQLEHGRNLWPIKIDQEGLERVIMNLAANSRDAMPNGGKLVIKTMNITKAESQFLQNRELSIGDYVLIEVCDTGTGIASDIITKIFDPFFTTKEVGKGTGLGLSMVYGIITQMGGYIYCRSKLNEGTCFQIYLSRYIENDPVLSQDQKQQAFLEIKNTELPSQDLSGSAAVLIVEDEDAVRMGSVKALESRGYKVFEASSGVGALEIIQEQKGKIDLVVSDVVMPEMDGPTLLAAVRELFPEIKFIFVSGYAEEAFEKNLPKGANFTFLAKPFSLKQLALAVKKILE